MRAFLVAVLALLAAAPADARIRESALRRHIAVLASDALAGRKPGTPGAAAAERYIVRQFARAGLAPGGKGGSWLQPVALPGGIVADNIVGRIPGSDRGAETILFLAHWDHLGLCVAAPAADRICNGAVDNASGVASLIEIARVLAKTPHPRRSLLFVATTGEEMGLRGARAFVADPPVPLASILAALNLDTVALAPRGSPVLTIGRGMTRLDPAIDETARTLGRTVDTSDRADAYVKRQDGWALLEAGVPAVLVGGAYGSRLAPFLAGRYHHPDDDLAHGVELGGAAEDADLLVALGRRLADPARFPALDRPQGNH